MRFIKLYEQFTADSDFSLNPDFLIEEHWLKYVPQKIEVTKDGRKASYELGKPCKNIDSVNLIYELYESESQLLPDRLDINISFKNKNIGNDAMQGNVLECILEITIGNLYVRGIKFTKKEVVNHIENKTCSIDKSSSKKIVKLINYISNNKLKIKSIK